MDDPRWTELDHDECRRLLQQQRIGRVAVVADGAPLVLPVTFVLDDDDVVFRTSVGNALDAALDDSPAAFEVDGIDEPSRTGWSVLVQGRARYVTGAAELSRVDRLGLVPWAPGDRPRFVRIAADRTTGRRIGVPPLPSNYWG
ncbi:pyridoxamine 5'-phosphate oxidase family protein [uncultured Cellulomonas sp.]|uniref:pyridoxamine 5'-phosphate oxidase family protein n=1 Tax=uncultured Cellulomonas sp. TaxID=189682 RepID=UPI002604B489|nr:pyridoxamine 5'-phosphate oxidase family protein [uncultured Cellulomonas sp.]